MQAAAAGDRAFVDEDYASAIQQYTKALEPGAKLGEYTPSGIYEARSYAHIKLQQWMEAVQDASKAVELDSSNAKAYLRKGMACYKLEEYETALEAFEAGAELAGDKNPQYSIWAQKCRIALAGDSYKATPTEVVPTVVLPPTPPPSAAKASEAAAGTSKSAAADAPAAPAAAAAAAAAAAKPQPAAPAASGSAPAEAAEALISDYGFSKNLAPMAVEEFTGKYRHQWYQLGNKVVIDVYAKKLPKDAVSVQLSGSDHDQLSIRIKAQPSSSSAAGEEEDYVLDLHLFDKVSTQTPVKTEVLSTKVEITLVKANTSIHWHTLEKGKGAAAAGTAAPAAPQPAQAQPAAASALKYPSSKGAKDWSKVEAEVLEGEGDLEDGDPLNNFFKKIFASGDEDTRRAMMKSFVESNGTVLSTNWQEVGAKPVEWKAPEGAEVKKWDV